MLWLRSGGHDGSADIIIWSGVGWGCGARTGGHDVHARTKEVRLLHRLSRLGLIEWLSGLERGDRRDLLWGLKGDDGLLWLRDRGDET